MPTLRMFSAGYKREEWTPAQPQNLQHGALTLQYVLPLRCVGQWGHRTCESGQALFSLP